MLKPGYRFQLRPFTSVLIAFSFLMLAVSGTVLFMAPPGRVANWTDWQILGLTKHEWGGLHIWFALLSVIGALLHLFFNLRPMLNYFKGRITRRMAFRPEWVGAVILCIGVFIGTKSGLVPFATLLAFNEQVKNSWEDTRTSAPIPHAELLTLGALAEQVKVPYETAAERLQNQGFGNLAPDKVIADIARSFSVSPQRIYEVISGSAGHGRGFQEGKGSGQGNSPGSHGGSYSGVGRQTLADYCANKGIDLQQALARLEEAKIKVSAEQTLREIALANGYDRPYKVLEIVEGRTVAE